MNTRPEIDASIVPLISYPLGRRDDATMTSPPPRLPPLHRAALEFGTWAHRLKSVYTGARMDVQVLAARLGEDPESALAIKRLDASLKKMEDLVAELERITGASLEGAQDTGPDYSPTSVLDVVKAVATHYRYTPKFLVVTVEPDLPPVVAHLDLLQEVLQILVDNAYQHGRLPQPHPCRLRAHRKDDAVCFDVHDSGPGFSPQALADWHAFDSTQAPAKPAVAEGRRRDVGVGLRLARGLLASWGGSLSLVHTAPGSTLMRVTLLPADSLPQTVRDPPLPDTAVGDQATVRRPRGQASDSPTILVVDDEPSIVASLAHHFSDRYPDGIVHTATTLEDAHSLSSSHTFDVAVVDVFLPLGVPAGLEVIRSVRQTSPEALILVLTHAGTLTLMRNAIALGADDYVSKAEISTEGISEALDRIESRREAARNAMRSRELEHVMYDAITAITHELRAPLLAIQRQVEALAGGALGEITEDQATSLASIRGAYQRQSRLLNAHIDLKRLELHSERLHVRECDLGRLIREEIAAHQDAAMEGQVDIQLNVSGHTPMLVRLDEERIRVALNPLLDNAIRYSPRGGTVEVELRANEGNVSMTISDVGPGIGPRELSMMLGGEPTPRGAPLGQRIRSSGLGLGMAKRFIELHGGALQITARDGPGTIVNVRLPLNSQGDGVVS